MSMGAARALEGLACRGIHLDCMFHPSVFVIRCQEPQNLAWCNVALSLYPGYFF